MYLVVTCTPRNTHVSTSKWESGIRRPCPLVGFSKPPSPSFHLLFASCETPLGRKKRGGSNHRNQMDEKKGGSTYRLILLIEIIHISIQNLHKQLHTDSAIHARISHSERPLQTFKHPLPIPIQPLGVLLPPRPVLHRPPQMAGQIDGAALVGLLQQLAAVESALGDQGVVVLFAEPPRRVQGASDDADGLELGAGVGDGFFVDGKGLGKEFVGDFFEGGLVGDLAAGDEEAEAEVGGAVASVEGRDGGVHEFVEGGRLGLPVVFVVFSRLVFSGEEGGGGVFDAFVAFLEGFAGCLEEAELGVVVGSLDHVDDSCEPALFYDGFICLCSPALAGYARIASWLLHAFSDDDSKNLKNSIKLLHCRDFCPVPQDAPGNLSSNCSPCRICLCVKKRYKIWEGEGGE